MAEQQENAIPEDCGCDGGRVWLTEEDLVAEIRAKQGTGKATSFSFGFGGRQRTWRACPKCTEVPS